MPHSPRIRPTRAGAALLALFLATDAQTSSSAACGFHDDVTRARGVMNWIYPDALHVVGAISTAVAQRRLPPPRLQTAPDLLGSRYRATVRSLERFNASLRASFDTNPGPTLSLVLIEPMLWTRFSSAPEGLPMDVHVRGPQPGDLVVVSGETVIEEVGNGRLSIGDAHRLGLIRLYGSDDQKSRFLATVEPGADGQDSAGASSQLSKGESL